MEPQPITPSVITSLRGLMPHRPLSYSEAMRIAELQASRLLKLSDITEAPVPGEVVSELPRIRVRYDERIPDSGWTYWDRPYWNIILNSGDTATRQRYSLFHEFKHVLDDPMLDVIYREFNQTDANAVERLCEYFAACVLMPKPWVTKRYFNDGIHDLATLARTFRVSPEAMRIRLRQLGITTDSVRCRGYNRPGQPRTRAAVAA